MPPPSKSTTATLLFLALLLLGISITQPLLSGLVIYRLSSNLSATPTLLLLPPTTSTCSDTRNCYIQLHIQTSDGPTAAAMFIGATGFLLALVSIVGYLRMDKGFYTPSQRTTHTLTLFILHTIYLLLAVATLTYIFIRQSPSHNSPSRLFPEDITPFFAYTLSGPFTRESWVCGLDRLRREQGLGGAGAQSGAAGFTGSSSSSDGDWGFEWTSRACGQAEGARWLLVPALVVAAGLVAFWGALWWARRRESRNGGVEKGRELGVVTVVA